MFRNPVHLLWLLPALGLTAGFFWRAAGRRRALTEAMGDPATIARLVPPEGAARRLLKAALQAAGLALIIVALAGPQWGIELVETKAPMRHVVIALDLSTSMLAEDVKPSRLEKAKTELSLLLEELRGNRVGIVAFAGEAAVLCPITMDVDAAKQVLGTMRVDALPRPGTAVSKAIGLAASTLERYPGGKAIVLLTDGEDTAGGPAAVEYAARRAAAAGIQLYPIGIGTPEGEPIPIKGEDGSMSGYKKDLKGNTVISRLGEDALMKAATASGGAYYRASSGEVEVSEIASKVAALEKSEAMLSRSQHYKNRFMFPLALAFIVLLIEMLIPETTRRAAPVRDGIVYNRDGKSERQESLSAS
ncbi:MAG: VWA domain-containing protein [Elusimicrobia bacterium]|nr:VWA domain-containing protein [Elusimicrobiota bacterium]